MLKCRLIKLKWLICVNYIADLVNKKLSWLGSQKPRFHGKLGIVREYWISKSKQWKISWNDWESNIIIKLCCCLQREKIASFCG